MTKSAEIKNVKSGKPQESSAPDSAGKPPLTKKVVKESSAKESGGDVFVSQEKRNSGSGISNAVYNPSQGSGGGGALHQVQYGRGPSGEEIKRKNDLMKAMNKGPELRAQEEARDRAERQDELPEMIREVKNSNKTQFEKDLILNILEPDYPKYEPEPK